jgi:hypothetical protein
MTRAVAMIVSLALAALPAIAAEPDLDRWFDKELVPYATSQLVEHPRFKGESVMFVVLEDNVPASVSNNLAISLRDRLLDAALNTPGVSIGRRQGGTSALPASQSVDCTRDDVHYYVGISVSRRIDGLHGVNVRALDLEDRNWVTGFGKAWQGSLSTIQQRAIQQTQADKTFRGARDVPFTGDESDLLAAHLAHDLSCALLRETQKRYVVSAQQEAEPGDTLAVTVELVGNNLAAHDALELTGDERQVNAMLSGKAHPIDGALYQYWLTVTPIEPGEELSTLSASAYVLLPGHRLAGAPPSDPLPLRDAPPEEDALPRVVGTSRATFAIPHGGGDSLLGPIRILKSQDLRVCAGPVETSLHATTYARSPRQCSVLVADAHADAIVFVLEHQANYGLVRLGGTACRERTAAHVVTRGTAMRYKVPFAAIGSSEMREAREWRVMPGIDTYYAFAVSDSRAAREFANHIDALPLRCQQSPRRGLEGGALQHWFEGFAVLAERHARHVGWRAIEIKDVL